MGAAGASIRLRGRLGSLSTCEGDAVAGEGVHHSKDAHEAREARAAAVATRAAHACCVGRAAWWVGPCCVVGRQGHGRQAHRL